METLSNKERRANLAAARFFLSAIIAASAIVFGANKAAHADLLISPTRVTFEGRDRTKQVALINQSDETKTYKVFFRDQRMTPQGQYEVLEEPDPNYKSALEMLKYSPRQVQLAPGQRQTVRLSLRRPAGLPDGEYRSHLVLEGLPNAATAQPKAEANQKGLGVQLHVRMAFALPVIVRHGQTQASANLSGFKFEPPASKHDPYPQLAMNIARTGNASTMGQLQVYWQQAPNSDAQKIGILNNVAIFPEMDHRNISVRLTEGRPKPGIITVVYAGTDEYKGRTWAKSQFRVTN